MDAQPPRDMLAEIKNFTGMTEVALSASLGVSQPTVNRLLNGQERCSSTTLLAILRLHTALKAGKLKPTEPAAA
ncbi:helix-turn-helix domain-containing protein [Paraburkholderia sp. EG304]|uniref:helix-turn-helix domain-containing protein n=1 Tax=Paraburkholderia sp. EG304 TaxID=3237015 RepID=UPI00397DE12A